MNLLRRSTLRSTACAVLLLAAVFVSTVAPAQPERTDKVALRVAACPQDFESSLRQILVIELGHLLDVSAPTNAPGGDSIHVACETQRLRISARSAGGGQIVHHDLVFGAFPGDAAPRAAALAALEALRAVDPSLADKIQAQREAQPDATPLEASSTVAPASTSAAKSDAGRASTPSRVRRAGARPAAPREAESPRPSPSQHPAFTRVLAGGVARFFLRDPKSSALGARLELSRRFSSSWDAGIDLEASIAQRSVGLGTVEARLLSSAAWLGARAFGPAVSATAALGGRLGIAELSGTPDDSARGHRVLRPFAGPILLLRGDAHAGPIALAVVLESGIAAVGAEGLAERTRAMVLSGTWLATSANAGIRF